MAASDPTTEARDTRAQRPMSAPLARGTTTAKHFQYVPSPSPIDPYVITSKQFDFYTSSLHQIGSAGEGGKISTPETTTSRMPTTYNPHTGPIRTATNPPTHQPHLHRGTSNPQHSFYEKVPAGKAANASQRKTAEDIATSAERQQQAIANNVAERLVEMQAQRQAVQRRIRPKSAGVGTPSAFHYQECDASRCVEGLQISRDVGTSHQSPGRSVDHELSRASLGRLGGFDSRLAVVRAAQSACLSAAPHGTSSSARKQFCVETLVPPYADNELPTDEPSLLLRHRRTELMLTTVADTEVPLVGVGMRALLLASEENVQQVASGVLVVAQVLGEDIRAHQEHKTATTREHQVPTAAPVYKDQQHQGLTGGESWRIVYAGQHHQPPVSTSPVRQGTAGCSSPSRYASHTSALAGKPYCMFGEDPGDMTAEGSSLLPEGEILNGSAVRIRGRPHTAPLSRDRRDAPTRPIDYLAQLRAASGSQRPSSAVRRPLSAQPTSKQTAAAAKPTRPYSAAGTGARSVYVLDAQHDDSTKPQPPEWLDTRGLIGVSVDPRYQAGRDALSLGREGFQLFPAADAVADAHPHHNRHHNGLVTGFRSGTALSAIRAARVKRDAAATEQQRQRGVLRGGAGFLMFSSSLATAQGGHQQQQPPR
jgi:hypothetical protein